MLGMIDALQSERLAYQANDGDVNYAVRKFAGYGKLSGKSLDDLRAGERVDGRTTRKHDPLDFVLWKQAKPDEPADAELGLEVGPRPSGLAHRMLGDGAARCSASTSTSTAAAQDLQFPHHENEIAQSEGATGKHVRELLDAQRLRAASTTRRCRSRSATSSRSAKCLKNTMPKSCASSLRGHTTAAR